MNKDDFQKELAFCLKLWEEKGGCMFGGGTKCEQCATPYLLWKFIAKEALHGEMERLTLDDWKKKLESIQDVEESK